MKNFFIWCSGADREILKSCGESDSNKFFGIGGTIFFTGLFASIAGGYALYRVFYSDENVIYFALGFGLLWGAMIFNLDRYIVSSIQKGGSWQQELLVALPRFIIAIIISIVIAKPLEVRLFSDRIAYEILNQKIDADSIKALQIKGNFNLDEKNDEVNIVTKKYNNANEKRKSDPDTKEFKDLQAELIDCNKAVQNLQNRYNIELNKLYKERKKIENGNTYVIVNGKRDYYVTAEADLRRINSRRGQINKLINNQKNICTKINSNIYRKRKDYQELWQNKYEEYQSKKDTSEIILAKAKVSSDNEINDAKDIIDRSFNENFMTQVEALSRLTKSDTSMRITSLFIMLLFIVIETAPVLVKLLSGVTKYDKLLKQKIDNIDDEVEALRNRSTELIELESYEKKLKLETQNELMDFYAEALKEVRKAEISKWKRDSVQQID